jgi:hypothetical protein
MHDYFICSYIYAMHIIKIIIVFSTGEYQQEWVQEKICILFNEVFSRKVEKEPNSKHIFTENEWTGYTNNSTNREHIKTKYQNLEQHETSRVDS